MRRFFKQNRDIIRSGLIFLTLSCGFIISLSTEAVERGPVKGLKVMIAGMSAAPLSLWDSSVNATGNLIQSHHFKVEVVHTCTGVYVMALLVSAILATPAPWRRRLPGIFAGVLLIYIVNLIRVMSLFLIGSYSSMEVFDFFHVYVWQTLVVLVTVAFFLGWIGTLPTEGTGSDRANDGDGGKDVDPERISDTALDRNGSTV